MRSTPQSHICVTNNNNFSPFNLLVWNHCLNYTSLITIFHMCQEFWFSLTFQIFFKFKGIFLPLTPLSIFLHTSLFPIMKLIFSILIILLKLFFSPVWRSVFLQMHTYYIKYNLKLINKNRYIPAFKRKFVWKWSKERLNT